MANTINTLANKAKKFITQFGEISTGYPWYIAYCEYLDGYIYARYGSLYSDNAALPYDQGTEYNAIIEQKLYESLKKCGNEIAYTYEK